MEVGWQQGEVSVTEDDNGEVMETQICLVLVESAGGLQRAANFHLSSMPGSAGEALSALLCYNYC